MLQYCVIQQIYYSIKNKIIKTIRKKVAQKITGKEKENTFSGVQPCDLVVTRQG